MTQQRSNDEIREDLRRAASTATGFVHDAAVRLASDFEPLLARVSELEQENVRLHGVIAHTASDVRDYVRAALADARTERDAALARAERAEALNREQERWIDEAVLALDSASVIGARSCREGDGLHLSNHDRLIREAREWSSYARYSTHSIEPLPRATLAAGLSLQEGQQ